MRGPSLKEIENASISKPLPRPNWNGRLHITRLSKLWDEMCKSHCKESNGRGTGKAATFEELVVRDAPTVDDQQQAPSHFHLEHDHPFGQPALGSKQGTQRPRSGRLV
jgi:hypothetical protein